MSEPDCSVCVMSVAGGRLLGVAEGAGPQQALPRAGGGRAVLHRPAQVPHAGAAGGALPARAHLHQQAGREAVPGAPAAARAAALLSTARPPLVTHTHTPGVLCPFEIFFFNFYTIN